jgi:hypothetical protein
MALVGVDARSYHPQERLQEMRPTMATTMFLILVHLVTTASNPHRCRGKLLSKRVVYDSGVIARSSEPSSNGSSVWSELDGSSSPA